MPKFRKKPVVVEAEQFWPDKPLHRLVCGLSFKNTLEAVATGKIDEVRAAIPDEFLGQFNAWVTEIESKVSATVERVERDFSMAPMESRKDFAQWAQVFAPSISPYLFAKLDGKDYTPLIYKREFAT